jgi:cyanophycinase
MPRAFFFLKIVLASFLVMTGSARKAPCQANSSLRLEPAQSIPGAVLICGEGKISEAVLDRFIQLAGGPQAQLVIVSQEMEPEGWKARQVKKLAVLSPLEKDEAVIAGLCREATGVWLEADKPGTSRNNEALSKELSLVLGRGGMLGGPGLGSMVPHLVIEVGGSLENRRERLLDALAKHPGKVGLGPGEHAVVELKGRTLTVLGQEKVVVCLAAGKDRPVSVQVLKSGDQADFIALSRAALARTQAPHPPLKPLAPSVPKGTLIIGGGGGLPDEVWKKFIEAAGGPKGRVVVITTALEQPLATQIGDVNTLKKMGAAQVKALHARSRKEVEAPEFLEALRQAQGLWFTGGRQWRLVDAYLDTKAHQEMQALLERGGVIGGSSAGASIQADYMVRGDPLGNLKIMAEGYERGLGFLQGVAIDQHFFKRKRTADMTELMARYPQLLGIGIDEGTALVVRGEIMEVIGQSNVAIYDRQRTIPEGKEDYLVLPPGSRFHLPRREKIE